MVDLKKLFIYFHSNSWKNQMNKKKTFHIFSQTAPLFFKILILETAILANCYYFINNSIWQKRYSHNKSHLSFVARFVQKCVISTEVDRFPCLERERNELTNSIERNRGNQQKLPDPNLNREVIFAVPSLQLHLKTEHLQTSSVPDVSGNRFIHHFFKISKSH